MLQVDMEKFVLLKKAHQLVLGIYGVTKSFPGDECYGLTSQIRRAAVSIPSNIVEGKARNANNDYKRFLLIARGSLEELKYQLFLSKDLGYLDHESFNDLSELSVEVSKLLNGVISSIDRG